MKLSHFLMPLVSAGVVAACSAQAPAGGVAEVASAAEPDEADVWTARGSEPGWSLTLDGETITFIHSYGEGRHVAPQPAAEPVEGGRRYTAGDGVLSVTALGGICRDDATGMPYPLSVTVRLAEDEVRGCGGETNALLAGEWAVVSLNGEAVAPGAGMTLVFEPQTAALPESAGAFVPGMGRVGGKAGCNSYGADYRLSGEGISIGAAFSTEMACEPDVMAREAAFLDALGQVSAIAFDDDGDNAGALVLSDYQDREIRATR